MTSVNQTPTNFKVVLEQRFGLLMSSTEVRQTLKFNSPSALSMARKRGHVNLTAHRLPGRRHLMFFTEDVARALSDLMERSGSRGEVRMDP
jgi:hypothetical protein